MAGSLKDADIRQLIEEYHQYEGDQHAHVDRYIAHPEGGGMHLVHFVDASGRKMSSLDIISLGAHGEYATEFDSCLREREQEMVQRYLCL